MHCRTDIGVTGTRVERPRARIAFPGREPQRGDRHAQRKLLGACQQRPADAAALRLWLYVQADELGPLGTAGRRFAVDEQDLGEAREMPGTFRQQEGTRWLCQPGREGVSRVQREGLSRQVGPQAVRRIGVQEHLRGQRGDGHGVRPRTQAQCHGGPGRRPAPVARRRLDQVPEVSVQVPEHGDGPVRLHLRLAYEDDPARLQGRHVPPEVIGVHEEEHPPARL